MGEELQNQHSSKDVKRGIKGLKDWISAKNIKSFLKERSSGAALATGISLVIGAGAMASLAVGGPPLALAIASWGGGNLTNKLIFGTLWDEIKKRIKKSTGKKNITDKEAADYILKLDSSEIDVMATAVCDKIKDNPEIKFFLTDVVREAVLSEDFKELVGQDFTEKIREENEKLITEIEKQHKEILEEIRKCGFRSFDEILKGSEKIGFDDIFEKFRRTIRLTPEELACVIRNGGTIERMLENDVFRNLDNGKNVLVLGISGSGKSILLMRICYELHLEGWKVFFTNERINSQKARELLGRTEGKKVLVVDNAAKYDEYFDLIENLRCDIRVIMVEQDIIWGNKERNVKGYNFDELKLELSEKEGIDYIKKFGGNKNLLKESKNIFPVLTFLIAEGSESLDRLVDAIWDGLNIEEKRVAYPIFVLSSLYLDYPRRLFNEIYDSPYVIEGLRDKNIIHVKESTISTIHPYLSHIIVERSTKDRFEEIDNLLEKINEKKSEERKEYYDFFFELGYNMGIIGFVTGIKKFFSYVIFSFDICIGINPENAKTWINKGVGLEETGKLEEALKCYDKALEINPESTEAWTNKGAALEKMGKLEEALKCCDKALEINPENAEVWTNKGIFLEKMGKYEEALKCYDKALEIKPEYTDAWINKGVFLGEMGKLEEALKCCDKALEINPEYATAWRNKAVTLEKMGKYKEALKCFYKFLDIKPADAETWHIKGCFYSLKNKKENALKCLSKAIEIDERFKEIAKKDENFKWLWDDEDFKSLVG